MHPARTSTSNTMRNPSLPLILGTAKEPSTFFSIALLLASPVDFPWTRAVIGWREVQRCGGASKFSTDGESHDRGLAQKTERLSRRSDNRENRTIGPVVFEALDAHEPILEIGTVQ